MTTKRKCKPSTKIKFQPSSITEYCSYCGELMVDLVYSDESTMLSCQSKSCTTSFIQRNRNTKQRGGSE